MSLIVFGPLTALREGNSDACQQSLPAERRSAGVSALHRLRWSSSCRRRRRLPFRDWDGRVWRCVRTGASVRTGAPDWAAAGLAVAIVASAATAMSVMRIMVLSL